MSCNKYLLLGLFLLGGCATQPTQAPPQSSDKTTTTKNSQAGVEADIALYANALGDIKANHLDKARTALTNLVEKHPELAGPWANLAVIDVRQNHYDKAREHLKKALERDANLAQAYNLLGYIDKKQGKISQAMDDYNQAVARKPDYALAHYNLALLYDIYLQDVPNAVMHYKRYLDLTGNQDQKTAEWVKELETSGKQQAGL
jgi:tetratricopeptide (TPR) repeat protein